MDYTDHTSVPVAWATLESDPFTAPASTCLPCTPQPNTPAPCIACPPNPTVGGRIVARDNSMPCCTTETYGGGTDTWPWGWGGDDTLAPSLGETLWQDQYAVRDRTATGFEFTPIFNPAVL